MADYLYSKIHLGDIITFRYNKKPTAAFELPRDIIVLTPNYGGFLHGIKLSGLTTTEQEFLQGVFRVMYGSHENLYSSLEQFINRTKTTLDVLNKERNELLKQNQAVVMRPAEQPELQGSGPFPNFQGALSRVRSALGSVIGKVSTFGRTQATAQPRGAVDPSIQQQIQRNDKGIQQTQKMLDYYMQLMEKNKQVFEQYPKLPQDPYVFYHNFLKSFIGNNRRMKNIYRKFDPRYIQNIRMVRTVGATPGVQRK